MLEREMKFLLDKAEFYALLNEVRQAYPNVQPREIDQTNYYYDTPDLQLYRQKITLRVRKKNSKLVIEKKVTEGYEGQVRRAIESKFPIAELPEKIHSAEVEIDGNDTFHLLGELHTLRARFALPYGTNIDFDVSEYCGITDYELEVELAAGADESALPKVLRQLAKKHSGKQARGKFGRFISSLE